MLMVMSYNFGVFITLIFGLTVGNFITSYFNLRKNINSFNDEDDALGMLERKKAGYRNASNSKVGDAILKRQATIDAHKTAGEENGLKKFHGPGIDERKLSK